MNENTTQLMEKFGDKLDHYLQALADKAGVAAEHFWPIFVKQQMIEGITVLFFIILFGLLSFFLLRMAINSVDGANNYEGTYKDVSKTAIGYVAGIILAFACFFTILVEAPPSIGKIFNPEYYAVQSLVEMVK
jgi:hypothetical protein